MHIKKKTFTIIVESYRYIHSFINLTELDNKSTFMGNIDTEIVSYVEKT